MGARVPILDPKAFVVLLGAFYWGLPRPPCERELLCLWRPSFIREVSLASDYSARPLHVAKRVFLVRTFFLFLLCSRKMRHICQTSVDGGRQRVFHLDGQRDAFPKFVLPSRERPSLGDLARQRGQPEQGLVSEPGAWSRGAYRSSFVSFGNEDGREMASRRRHLIFVIRPTPEALSRAQGNTSKAWARVTALEEGP